MSGAVSPQAFTCRASNLVPKLVWDREPVPGYAKVVKRSVNNLCQCHQCLLFPGNSLPCICKSGGNFYSPIISTNCQSYTQHTDISTDPITLCCPGELLFDVQTCVCNWPAVVQCSNSSCPSTETTTATRPVTAPQNFTQGSTVSSANVTTETITLLPNVTSSEATTLFRNVTQGVTSAQVNVTADSTTTSRTDSSSGKVYFINSDAYSNVY